MHKKNRKEKLKARKQREEQNRLALSKHLSTALEELCEPYLSEYTDDSKGIDLLGRKILYQFGQISWNIAISEKELDDNFLRFHNLQSEERKEVNKDLQALIKRKKVLFPNDRVSIEKFTMQISFGRVILKVKPGKYIPVPEKTELNQEEITPEKILSLRKKLSMTQVTFSKNLGISVKRVSALEHGKSPLSKQEEVAIRQLLQSFNEQ